MTNHTGITISLKQLIDLRQLAQGLDISSKKLAHASYGGVCTSKYRGRGMDFDECRVYLPGDEIRNMDWRVTARTGRAHTKLYREERERPVYLVIDLSSCMHFGTRVAFKSVIARQLAALLAWAGVANGDRVGAIAFTGNHCYEFRPMTGTRAVLPLLRVLALPNEHNENGQNNLAFALQRLRHVLRPGSLLFIISDFTQLQDEAITYLGKLALNSEIIANFIYDPIEKDAPLPDRYRVSDGAMIATLDTQQSNVREHYHASFTNYLQQLKSTLYKYHIPLLSFATNQDVGERLRQQMHQRKVKTKGLQDAIE